MRLRALLLTALLTLTAACGTSEPAATESASGSAGQVSVTDGAGKTITLDQPATRVVTLEWGQTEDVVTLGVQPVGVADPKGYASWVTSAPLTGDPVDVGLRTEPSVESIAKADPDVIIGITESIPESALAQIEKIAPVVLLKGADATRPLDLMRENFTTIATLLAKTEQAKTPLADLDTHLWAAATKLKASDKAAKPFVFTYVNATGNTVDFRMHGPRSQPGAIAQQLGLTNAYTEEGDAAWGLGSLDVEGFTKLPADTQILYWGNQGVDDPVKGALAKNAVWKGLASVKNDQVVRTGDGIWMYGGPASTKQWADALVAALG